MAQHKYFVSIREGWKGGQTVWASRVMATDLKAARTHAELEFTTQKVCPSSDPNVIKFYEAMEATRVRVMAAGLFIMGHRSNAKD